MIEQIGLNMFDFIENIDPENELTFNSKIFLIFDVDWAHDEIIDNTLEILQPHKVASTWFLTHETIKNKILHESGIVKTGIHPNFNEILMARSVTSFSENLDKSMKLIESPKVVRSHSQTQSSRILDRFAEIGITHDCNHYIPFHSGIELKPWRIWNNIIKVPVFWEDDLDICRGKKIDLATLVKSSGLKVFSFHPIHIFLNSNNLDLYEKTRKFHNQPKKLIHFINKGYGVRNFLEELLDLGI